MNFKYVLVTPVRNEVDYIERTILSVINQNTVPKEWVIVSDASSDGTDDIVKKYAQKYEFINFVRLNDNHERNFAAAVYVREHGVRSLRCKEYDFIGFLDSDIELNSDYYQRLLKEFENSESLGLAGGEFEDLIGDKRQVYRIHHLSVPGALQFFRKECFLSLNGMTPIREGGFDAINGIKARMNGWETRLVRHLKVKHLKPMNISQGNMFKRKYQMGVRDYSLGNHPLFEFLMCSYRWFERPYFISSLLRLSGFFLQYIKRSDRGAPIEVIAYMRREQMCRLFPFLKV